MKKNILLPIFSLLCGFTAAQPVTLDECRKMARNNYPMVQQYALVEKSEQYNLSNAARAWLPQVRLSAQATWQSDAARFPESMSAILSATGTEINGIQQDQYKLAIDVQQNLWDGGRAHAEKKMANLQSTADRLVADADFYALDGRVENLFFSILLLEEQQTQTESRIALLEENMRRCDIMLKNEMLMQSDLDAVEVELLTAGQQLEQLRSSRTAFREMLSLLTGKELRNEQLIIPEEPVVSSLPADRPEALLIAAKISMLEAQEKQLRSANMPQFSAFAQGWYGYPGLNMFENMLNDDWSLNAIIGVKMSWNISGFYTQNNRVEQLKLSQRQLSVQREVFDFNNRLQRSQELGEIARLRRALQDDERIIALRRSVREAAETKQANGTIGTTELLRAITEEGQAQSAQSLHKIELLKKMYELKRL